VSDVVTIDDQILACLVATALLRQRLPLFCGTDAVPKCLRPMTRPPLPPFSLYGLHGFEANVRSRHFLACKRTGRKPPICDIPVGDNRRPLRVATRRMPDRNL
jgi:hypothetical protein